MAYLKNDSSRLRPTSWRRHKGFVAGRKQCGAAALVATVILVIIGSLSALVVGKAAFSEQKLSGVDIRNKEVYAAAVGTLQYAETHLETVFVDGSVGLNWVDAGGAASIGLVGDTAPPVTAFANAAGGTTIDQGADTYGLAIVYTLLTDMAASPAVVEITATATAEADTHVMKTITAQYLISDIGSSSLWDGPPMIVEDCVSGITGTPDLYTDDGTALGTLNGDCVDPGLFDANGSALLADSDLIDTNVGEDDEDGNPLSLHETLFPGVPVEQLKFVSELQASLGLGQDARSIYYIDADFTDTSGATNWNGNAWDDDIGLGTVSNVGGTPVYTPDHPVVLYFDASMGCPPVNGNVTIWGVVFYAAESCDTEIGAVGGGKATVYGTVAFSGDLTGYNANTEIYNVDLSPSDPGEGDIRIMARLPGSWKDF